VSSADSCSAYGSGFDVSRWRSSGDRSRIESQVGQAPRA
jgi:hypothetical protein